MHFLVERLPKPQYNQESSDPIEEEAFDEKSIN